MVQFENFVDIKTKEVAYILGFLWADGYIRKPYNITTTINIKDSIDIKNVFSRTGDWNFYEINRYDKRNNRKYKNFTITTSNKILVNFLLDHDYDKKSYINPYKILSKISTNLKIYFIRGFCDGDGCFYKNKSCNQFTITGTYNQNWNWIEDVYNELKIKYSIILRMTAKSGYSQIRISNKNDIDILGDFIYQEYTNENIGLNRKFLDFSNIKNITVKRISNWNKNDIDFLISNYNNLSNKEIGLALNKSKYSIDAKASKLKLKKHNINI